MSFLAPLEAEMLKYTYLIIGGGMTAAAAINGIHELDPNRRIGLIGAEAHRPYDRPPLTKGLWKGKPFDSIWRELPEQAVELHLGRTATKLDAQQKRVTDDRGTVYGYEKLLLALGGTPRRLPFDGEQILYYRTVDDYSRLREQARRGQRFAVIGGGFIGSEIAAALTMNGVATVMVFPDASIGGRLFPADLAEFLNDYYRQRGVEVLPGERVIGCETRRGRSAIKVSNARSQGERELLVDGVIAGIGIQPNVDLARAAGLEVSDGIHVNASLRTSHPDIFAAGDVANFHNPALDKRLRVEHEDNANTMGKLAGQIMAGQAAAYDHLPSFYSDLFDLGYEAVGEVDSRLETVSDWEEPYRKGIVYYLRDGRVRGALLWNVWEQVDAARLLIAESGPFSAASLRGRLPA
jgi:NADPH-dependent 2,4-dienoyl-CoA reductase/sulfur reductase-like enzyme